MTPTASDPIRTAVVGYGNSARIIHRALLESQSGFEITAVVTTRPAARDASRRAGLSVVASIQEAARAGATLAVICLPDSMHEDAALEALKAGMHISLEKPAAPTSAAVARIDRLARDRRRIASVFHNRRWDDDVLTAADLVATGELGAIERYSATLGAWNPDVGSGWRDRPRPGGVDGRLGDLGSHLVDQAVQLFGPVSDVFAHVTTMRPGSRVNDDCMLLLSHASGVRGELLASSARPLHGPRLEVQGRDAAFVSHGSDPQDVQLRDGLSPRSERWGRRPPGSPPALLMRPGARSETVERRAGKWQSYYEELR
ncbi:MAG TPA: Gfo/Idh/MocA family oxidoreductase, partial [Microbacterium sp.]|uniref:Gfo/Idh/MocA family protein n=1 Tax=Microbacterium sp. TaxID=51671 RepID=UPI002C94EF15